MKNKLWMAIFKLEPPICTCGRPMTVLEVTRYHKDYLILHATDDGDSDKKNGFYILYSIKNMKTFGGVHTHCYRKEEKVRIFELEKELQRLKKKNG